MWMTISRFIIYILSLSIVCATVNAQNGNQLDLFDIPLEDLKNVTVSSIDFSNRSLNDSFASTYVINAQKIESMPMITLTDHIEMLIPSTNIVTQGTNGAGTAIRGTNTGASIRTLTMWDGSSLNRRNSGGNNGVFYSPLLNDLHQIEVVLGPGSVKHGTGALDGYINFVPKSGQNFQGSRADIDYGSDDSSQRIQLQHGVREGNNQDFYIYAGAFHADGYRLSNDFGGSIAPVVIESRKFTDRDELIVGNYDPSYKLSINWTQNRFNLKTLFEHLEFNPGGAIFNRNITSQQTTLTVQPKYTFQLPGKSSFELSSAATFFDKSRVNPAIAEGLEFIESGGREAYAEIRGSYQTLYFNDHELTLGAQMKWLDSTSEKHFFSADPTSHRRTVDGKWQEFSMYFEDIYSFSNKTTFNAGLRYDGAYFNDEFRFDLEGLDLLVFKPGDISNYSPRLGMTHRLENDFLIRAGYSEGFAYPDLSTYSRTFAVNQFLESRGIEMFDQQKPESIQSYEFGLRGDLIQNELLFDLSFYYNRYKNNARFVNFRTNPSFLPGDLTVDDIPDDIFGIVTSLDSNLDGYGSEISFNWKPNNNFFANVSYSYAVPDHVSEQDNELIRIANAELSEWSHFPKHQFRSDLNLKYNNWQFSLAGVYQSGIEIDRKFTPTRSNAEDDYVRVNFGINYRLNKDTSISFIAKNVFNNRTPRTTNDTSRAWQGALGTDERLLYLGLRYSF